MLAPPPRSTPAGFQVLDFLISGLFQDVGFQIPDFQIGTPYVSRVSRFPITRPKFPDSRFPDLHSLRIPDSRFPDLQAPGFQIPDFQKSGIWKLRVGTWGVQIWKSGFWNLRDVNLESGMSRHLGRADLEIWNLET